MAAQLGCPATDASDSWTMVVPYDPQVPTVCACKVLPEVAASALASEPHNGVGSSPWLDGSDTVVLEDCDGHEEPRPRGLTRGRKRRAPDSVLRPGEEWAPTAPAPAQDSVTDLQRDLKSLV